MAAQTAFDATFQSGNWVQGGIPEARLEASRPRVVDRGLGTITRRRAGSPGIFSCWCRSACRPPRCLRLTPSVCCGRIKQTRGVARAIRSPTVCGV